MVNVDRKEIKLKKLENKISNQLYGRLYNITWIERILKVLFEKIKIKLGEYKLELNINKTRIDSIKNGIDFIGYRFYIKDNKIIIKLRDRTKKNFKNKAKDLKLLKENNYIDSKKYYNLLSSYKGLCKYCNNLYRYNIEQTININV